MTDERIKRVEAIARFAVVKVKFFRAGICMKIGHSAKSVIRNSAGLLRLNQ